MILQSFLMAQLEGTLSELEELCHESVMGEAAWCSHLSPCCCQGPEGRLVMSPTQVHTDPKKLCGVKGFWEQA